MLSHLRRASFGPSNGGLYGPYVARLAAKEQTGIVPIGHYITTTLPPMARLWPTYLMRHGPFLARLVFSNEKGWGNEKHIKYVNNT